MIDVEHRCWSEAAGCSHANVVSLQPVQHHAQNDDHWSDHTRVFGAREQNQSSEQESQMLCNGSTWRRHTGKHVSSTSHQRITQPTSWPHVASLTWSSSEQVARPATKRLHPSSDWRALETCCRPWTWWCNDATALAGYATMMTMMMICNGVTNA